MKKLGLLLGLLSTAVGCGGDPADFREADGEGRVNEVEQGIIGGTPFSPEGLYYVSVHHGGPGNTSTAFPYNICSGTLLRNDAVLTARHCVTYERTIGGTIDTNYGDFELLIGSQTSGVREIIDLGTDVALIITERFFRMHGRTVDWRVPVYASPSSTLIGRELFCAGYGVNSAATDPYTADILRFAWLAPNAVTSQHLVYPTNASGQGLWKGDSGGSCIYTGTLGTALEATGVNSTCASAAGPCHQIKPELFRAGLNSALAARGAAFVHRATAANTSGHVTTIDHPDTNDRPSAIVSVTPNWNPDGSGGTYDNHNIGVYYWGGRWRIFNQDFAAMPANAAFNVSVGSGFVHAATSANTSGHITTLDHPQLNGRPNAAFIVTPNWNGGTGTGVYLNHPIGVYYTGGRWRVFNQDIASMPLGAKFNVRIDRSQWQRGSSGTVSHNWMCIDDPNLNGRPEARVFVTANWNPGGVGGRYVSSPLGVWYNHGSACWAVFRQDGANMPVDAGFNYLVRP